MRSRVKNERIVMKKSKTKNERKQNRLLGQALLVTYHRLIKGLSVETQCIIYDATVGVGLDDPYAAVAAVRQAAGCLDYYSDAEVAIILLNIAIGFAASEDPDIHKVREENLYTRGKISDNHYRWLADKVRAVAGDLYLPLVEEVLA